MVIILCVCVCVCVCVLANILEALRPSETSFEKLFCISAFCGQANHNASQPFFSYHRI